MPTSGVLTSLIADPRSRLYSVPPPPPQLAETAVPRDMVLAAWKAFKAERRGAFSLPILSLFSRLADIRFRFSFFLVLVLCVVLCCVVLFVCLFVCFRVASCGSATTERQQKALGDLWNGVTIPCNDDDDALLIPALAEDGFGLSTAGADLHHKLSTRDRVVGLIGKTGCGKTRALFDVAKTGYCVRFEEAVVRACERPGSRFLRSCVSSCT